MIKSSYFASPSDSSLIIFSVGVLSQKHKNAEITRIPAFLNVIAEEGFWTLTSGLWAHPACSDPSKEAITKRFCGRHPHRRDSETEISKGRLSLIACIACKKDGYLQTRLQIAGCFGTDLRKPNVKPLIYLYTRHSIALGVDGLLAREDAVCIRAGAALLRRLNRLYSCVDKVAIGKPSYSRKQHLHYITQFFGCQPQKGKPLRTAP